MDNARCETCAEFRTRYQIATPGELTKVIRAVRGSLAKGELTDITQPAHSPSGKFGELSEVGPWPDYIEHYFSCNGCGHRFRLVAETYHGAGGEWEPYTV